MDDDNNAKGKDPEVIASEIDDLTQEETPQPGEDGEAMIPESQPEAHKYYIPLELRTWYLVGFSIITLAIFVLLQLAAASSALRRIGGRDDEDNSGVPQPGAPISTAFSSFESWGTGSYLVAQYLPTTIAILYGLFWKCTWFRLKEFEPIWQLARPMGQYGGWSLYLKFIDKPFIEAAWMAFGRQHWCVLLGAINVTLTTICTAFAPEVLYIRTTGECGPSEDGSNCVPHLAIRSPLAWVLGVVVFGASVVSVVLVIKQKKRESKLYAEASSIAGIAALITDPEHPRILAGCPDDPYVFERYMLETVTKIDGSKAYGIIGETRPESTATYPYSPAVPPKYKAPMLFRLPFLGSLWFLQVGLLILIIIYRYVSKVEPGNGFESFMDSNSFGVKLLFAIVGLAIRSFWSRLDAHRRSQAPYRSLCSANGASAADSVCAPTHAHPLPALLSARSFKYPLDGLTSLIALLAEVLVVTLSSVPYSAAISYAAFNASVLISITILGLMIISLPLLCLKMWQQCKTVPPPATCLADVIRLLTDKEAQKAFMGLSKETRRNRDIAIKSRAGRWRLEQGTNGEWALKVC